MASHLNNSSSSEQLKPGAPNSPKSTKKESVLDKAWFISLMCILSLRSVSYCFIWRKRPHPLGKSSSYCCNGHLDNILVYGRH